MRRREEEIKAKAERDLLFNEDGEYLSEIWEKDLEKRETKHREDDSELEEYDLEAMTF